MKKRVFSPEFKDEAVRLVREQGVSVRQASEDLGIGQSTLQKWLKAQRDRKEANGQEVSEAEMAELKRLRKENHRLRMERDILKKDERQQRGSVALAAVTRLARSAERKIPNAFFAKENQ